MVPSSLSFTSQSWIKDCRTLSPQGHPPEPHEKGGEP